jgi:hypothetical protein
MLLAHGTLLPDAAVWFLPSLDDNVGEAAEQPLHVAMETITIALEMLLYRAENLTVDIELELTVSIVSDAHRSGALITLQVAEDRFG